MKQPRLRLVFLGSPPVAVRSLELLSGRFQVALVVTQPERPKGRGRRMLATPVHRRADELGLPVLAAADVNRDDVVAGIARAEPDALVVVSFGQILRRGLLDLAPLGCINLHFSLLPRLRGAAPVPWAIMRGLGETGVSIMRLVPRMDAGPVWAQAAEPILQSDTAASLQARLGQLGAKLLEETLAAVAAGGLEPHAQDEDAATFAPKITRADAAVDWALSGEQVDRLIRGLSGQLEAFAFLEKEPPIRVNFYMSALRRGPSGGPGVAARGAAGELVVGCGADAVEILEIQAQGRKRLSGREFANGYHIKGGERFLGGQ